MNERLNGLLGMARRAGRLTAGFDAVKELIVSKRAKCVLLACDISEKTEKELRFAAGAAVPFFTIEFNKEEIGHAIGSKKSVGVIATEDTGFAAALKNAAAPVNEEDAYGCQ